MLATLGPGLAGDSEPLGLRRLAFDSCVFPTTTSVNAVLRWSTPKLGVASRSLLASWIGEHHRRADHASLRARQHPPFVCVCVVMPRFRQHHEGRARCVAVAQIHYAALCKSTTRRLAVQTCHLCYFKFTGTLINLGGRLELAKPAVRHAKKQCLRGPARGTPAC